MRGSQCSENGVMGLDMEQREYCLDTPVDV